MFCVHFDIHSRQHLTALKGATQLMSVKMVIGFLASYCFLKKNERKKVATSHQIHHYQSMTISLIYQSIMYSWYSVEPIGYFRTDLQNEVVESRILLGLLDPLDF
jgi:hypothetical protein